MDEERQPGQLMVERVRVHPRPLLCIRGCSWKRLSRRHCGGRCDGDVRLHSTAASAIIAATPPTSMGRKVVVATSKSHSLRPQAHHETDGDVSGRKDWMMKFHRFALKGSASVPSMQPTAKRAMVMEEAERRSASAPARASAHGSADEKTSKARVT